MIKKIMALALLMSSHVLLAAPASQELTALLRQTQNIKANFVQTVYGEQHSVLSKSTGYFILQQPGRFYWVIATPMKQIIINDGQKIWNYQPELEQVVVKSANQAVQATPLAILGGSSSALQRGFTITRVDQDTFRLQAKKSGTFKYIWLHFTKGIISSMKLQDALGQSTELKFSKVVTNLKVSNSKFKFTAPSGVDVIKSM